MVSQAAELDAVPCPFCGLACDDLRIAVRPGELEVLDNGCSLAAARFRQAVAASDRPAAYIDGELASLDEALAHAAEILRTAKLTLIGGLATDVAGTREALRLSERCGAVLSHRNAAAMERNMRVLQGSGWITTTLTEARNRADCMVVLGSRIFELFPRFLERVYRPRQTLIAERASARKLVLVGPWQETELPPELRDCCPTVIHVAPEQIADIATSLRAVLRRAPLQTSSVAGVDVTRLVELAERLKAAKYGVLVWASGDLAFPHADLTVAALVELVRELNHTTRCVGLPLGGNDGDLTANQVCLWQTGYPLPVSFWGGYPEYEPRLCDPSRLISDAQADALLWIDSYSPDRGPPRSALTTIALGHPAMEPTPEVNVFIPVGIPGIDHPGHFFRSDSVVALPLRKLRPSTLPSVATVLAGLTARLESVPHAAAAGTSAC